MRGVAKDYRAAIVAGLRAHPHGLTAGEILAYLVADRNAAWVRRTLADLEREGLVVSRAERLRPGRGSGYRAGQSWVMKYYPARKGAVDAGP